MSSKELFVSGYLRQNETKYRLNIPRDIVPTILMFIKTKYEVYGVGEGDTVEQGQAPKNTFYHIKGLSKLCQQPDFLFPHCQHTLCLERTNKIHGCGYNHHGQLGYGPQYFVRTFGCIEFKDIDDDYNINLMNEGACSCHNIIIFEHKNTSNKLFYGFGDNKCYQLGNISESEIRIPTLLTQLNNIFSKQKIIEISTGYEHTLFLSSSGKVYACGFNENGQCGIDPSAAKIIDKPQIIAFLYDIAAISSGWAHNLCIDEKGALWVFGDNGQSQLGLGADYEDIECVHAAMINPYFKGDKDENKIKIAKGGRHHSLCITMNGKAYTFGGGDSGQCGNGDKTVSFAPYCINDNYDNLNGIHFDGGSCGGAHTILLSVKDQKMYGFGHNYYYQCGDCSTRSDQLKPYELNKKDIGIADDCGDIVDIICGYNNTIFVCESFDM